MRGDLRFWLAFLQVPGIGPQRFQRLLDHFGDLGAAWQAPPKQLEAAGLEERLVQSVVRLRGRLDLDGLLESLERSGIHALTWDDPAYPWRLKEINDPPPVFFVRGELVPQDGWAIAVVGTRRASAYGRQAAEVLAGALAQRGITVISGLARGIDAVAHRVALEAGGRTIAVEACGLDLVYPPEHRRLALDIAAQGALVSEYPPGTRPQAQFFPRRNRLMSGISLGVLVVEADEESGALITARWALEQGREVFAVPGSIFSPLSRGTHELIQQGAKLVMRVEDILEELNLRAVAEVVASPAPPASVDDDERRILQALSTEAVHVDELAHRVGLPVALVSANLALLEMKGLVRAVGGMQYMRTPQGPAPPRQLHESMETLP